MLMPVQGKALKTELALRKLATDEAAALKLEKQKKPELGIKSELSQTLL